MAGDDPAGDALACRGTEGCGNDRGAGGTKSAMAGCVGVVVSVGPGVAVGSAATGAMDRMATGRGGDAPVGAAVAAGGLAIDATAEGGTGTARVLVDPGDGGGAAGVGEGGDVSGAEAVVAAGIVAAGLFAAVAAGTGEAGTSLSWVAGSCVEANAGMAAGARKAGTGPAGKGADAAEMVSAAGSEEASGFLRVVWGSLASGASALAVWPAPGESADFAACVAIGMAGTIAARAMSAGAGGFAGGEAVGTDVAGADVAMDTGEVTPPIVRAMGDVFQTTGSRDLPSAVAGAASLTARGPDDALARCVAGLSGLSVMTGSARPAPGGAACPSMTADEAASLSRDGVANGTGADRAGRVSVQAGAAAVAGAGGIGSMGVGEKLAVVADKAEEIGSSGATALAADRPGTGSPGSDGAKASA
jgi:hypothetical protein